MAKAKKSAKESSNIFHNIIQASVSQHIKPDERFYRDDRDFLIKVFKEAGRLQTRIYEIDGEREVLIGKKDFKEDTDLSEVRTSAKKWIESYLIGGTQ